MPTGENSSNVKLAFAACSPDLIDQFVEEVSRMGNPSLPVYCVSEFQPSTPCHWIPWQPFESLQVNRNRIRFHLSAHRVLFNCILVQPRQPYWNMRFLALRLFPTRVYFFNENYGHFPLHPRGIPSLLRHFFWRARNLIRHHIHPGGPLYTWLWRLGHPFSLERPLYAWIAARRPALPTKPLRSEPAPALSPGITVVIPTRDGRALLETLLPLISPGLVKQVILVDNGSSDTTHSLASDFVRVLSSDHPLSFAAAVNRGIRASRTTHTCLLNNDMVIEPGFFAALDTAFRQIPDLFCATAQIFLPPGKRREETGKAVYSPQAPSDFPLRCDTPVEGEDLSPVLYGSGGCSLYDTAKLLTLGCFKESFRPAYVEDLDIGWRGWQQGWPTVFVAAARVVHHHRSTTSRFLSAATIELAIEQNFLRWIQSSVATPTVYESLWRPAVHRLNLLAAIPEPAPIAIFSLRFAAFDKPYYSWDRPAEPVFPEDQILALGSGEIACFPGLAPAGKPRLLIATSYLPFPLSHGGAVRMYNLMREAARDYSLILLSFVDSHHPPPPELLTLTTEIITVRRSGSHYRRTTARPKVVEDFDSPAFAAAIGWIQRRWQPCLAQLEFTQMAQYAAAVKPARSILVEHDITLDLYSQLLAAHDDFDTRLELDRWQAFEHQAWRDVDSVVVMSQKDAALITGARNVTVIANGVDIERFTPSTTPPTSRRLLFIGSLAHLPNLMALAWFLNEVFPRLSHTTLHIIAGNKPDYYLDFYRDRVQINLNQPGIELEAFVSDVRPAYQQAEIVIAPLLASAGTNIKIMEAMACGKAIVATPGGVNGLDLTPGSDFLLASSPAEFAAAIQSLMADPRLRQSLEQQARSSAVSRYSWSSIARRQHTLYQQLLQSPD
ncbi:MAG: glycosyltransferase [Bryobacter sp.]|nr:glycosyltransferase [Bryobacter sp. CoA8 C33]